MTLTEKEKAVFEDYCKEIAELEKRIRIAMNCCEKRLRIQLVR